MQADGNDFFVIEADQEGDEYSGTYYGNCEVPREKKPRKAHGYDLYRVQFSASVKKLSDDNFELVVHEDPFPTCLPPYMHSGSPMKLTVAREQGHDFKNDFKSTADDKKQWSRQFGVWKRDRDFRPLPVK